jgi:hypothetical protein
VHNLDLKVGAKRGQTRSNAPAVALTAPTWRGWRSGPHLPCRPPPTHPLPRHAPPSDPSPRPGEKQSIARSFGFAVPPRVSLNIESRSSHARKAARVKGGASKGGAEYKRGTGHTFSAANPYGKRAAGDTRQFIRG